MSFDEYSGWVGSVLLLASFFLVSRGFVANDDVSYQLMNLIGAVGLGINFYARGSRPGVALEFFWGGIAMYTLVGW